MNIDPTSSKYLIRASIRANGVVNKSDVVGAVFGQTEGLLGDELDLRDLQKSGRMGRVEVEIKSDKGKSIGEIVISSSMDQVETSVFAAALETVERVGPCKATVKITTLEDSRTSKREIIIDRARSLLINLIKDSRGAGSTITDTVRQVLQTEEIVRFKGKLPAGPNVDTSDAVIVVEGRGDVLNLLRHGIKNAVAVEGTNIPKEVVALSKERTVTAFVDGDRGGEMIIQELLQVAEIDFISRAPSNTEVEHLTHKQIMKSLRDKVSAELFMEQNKWSRPGSSGTKAKSSDKKTRRGTKSKSSKEEKVTPKEKEVTEEVPAEAAVASPVFVEQLDQLQGTKNARLLMGDEVADEVSISGLQEVLETRKNNGVNTLVMDGIITQRLIELVPKAGIKIIVAEKKGPLPRDPVGITMFTREDLN
uniref:DNA primase DnaG n=1 Tax=uncultured marine group II/III euryarchaeote KM3_13_C08 TaxID=1457871 RepID=A0A075G9V9_9EURY|nr:TOPRIM domain-containing protein [uncultured marine group II/III euryarchaeote KM3_13_C08]